LQDVTRYDHRSLDFLQATISKDDSLEGECFLQLLDDRTSLEFLNETDGSVKQ